jgi:hypothetical protein
MNLFQQKINAEPSIRVVYDTALEHIEINSDGLLHVSVVVNHDHFITMHHGINLDRLLTIMEKSIKQIC